MNRHYLTRGRFIRLYHADTIWEFIRIVLLSALMIYLTTGVVRGMLPPSSLHKYILGCIALVAYIFNLIFALADKAKQIKELDRCGEIQSAVEDFNRPDTIHIGTRYMYRAFGTKYIFDLRRGKMYRYDEVASISLVRNYEHDDGSDHRKHTVTLSVVHDCKNNKMLVEKISKPTGVFESVIKRIKEVRPDMRFVD